MLVDTSLFTILLVVITFSQPFSFGCCIFSCIKSYSDDGAQTTDRNHNRFVTSYGQETKPGRQEIDPLKISVYVTASGDETTSPLDSNSNFPTE